MGKVEGRGEGQAWGNGSPSLTPLLFPWLVSSPCPPYHMTPYRVEPPQTSQTGPSPSLRSGLHTPSPGAFPFYAVSAQLQP